MSRALTKVSFYHLPAPFIHCNFQFVIQGRLHAITAMDNREGYDVSARYLKPWVTRIKLLNVLFPENVVPFVFFLHPFARPSGFIMFPSSVVCNTQKVKFRNVFAQKCCLRVSFIIKPLSLFDVLLCDETVSLLYSPFYIIIQCDLCTTSESFILMYFQKISLHIFILPFLSSKQISF